MVAAVGTTGEGVDDLWAAIAAHREHLCATGVLERRREQRLREELALVVEQRIRAEADARLGAGARAEIERDLVAGRVDPWTAAERIVGGR